MDLVCSTTCPLPLCLRGMATAPMEHMMNARVVTRKIYDSGSCYNPLRRRKQTHKSTMEMHLETRKQPEQTKTDVEEKGTANTQAPQRQQNTQSREGVSSPGNTCSPIQAAVAYFRRATQQHITLDIVLHFLSYRFSYYHASANHLLALHGPHMGPLRKSQSSMCLKGVRLCQSDRCTRCHKPLTNPVPLQTLHGINPVPPQVLHSRGFWYRLPDDCSSSNDTPFLRPVPSHTKHCAPPA
jgi:hypothetical protein